ncbi:MAG: nucleotidyltransferase domain-containing protein [Desulfuromonadales bacterium]
MSEQDRALIEEFRRRLPSDIVPHIKDVIMYGSRARGDADADSDLDLVALVDENSVILEQKLDDIVYNLMWDHDFKLIISLKVFSEQRFLAAAAKGYSYYRNIVREGISV